jgi:hypothetical protein
VIYETQHPGVVPERTGAHIGLLEATIDFTQLVESGSSGRHVIAQFKHDADALGPEQPFDDVPAGSTAKRDDHSSAGFERHASKVVIISAEIAGLANASGGTQVRRLSLKLETSQEDDLAVRESRHCIRTQT